MSFVDELTRMTWVSLIKFKHKMFFEFKKFIIKVENQSGQKLKVLRTDGICEYNSTKFGKFCEDNGIDKQKKLYSPSSTTLSFAPFGLLHSDL